MVDVGRTRILDALTERLYDRGLHGLEPVFEVDGRHRRLEHRCQHVPTARDALQLVGGCVAGELEQALPEPELFRDRRTALP